MSTTVFLIFSKKFEFKGHFDLGKPIKPYNSKIEIMWYVYILQCNDQKYYVGCTSDLRDRVHRHNLGHVQYTKPRRPVKLVSYTAFNNKYKAFGFEFYLKSGSGRSFMKRRFL
jgi:predicted GIY-YIG superfamily endonuclease